MKMINIGTFSLEAYDKNNPEHKDKAKLFESDDDFCEYVGEFWDLASSVNHSKEEGKYSEIYFAYIDDILIGMVGLIWIMDIPELVIGILPDKRGNHYSNVLYQEYTNYVFTSYKEYQEIYAYIHSENIHSVENALMAGFKRLDETMYVKKRYPSF